jgi:hypothetical protein
MWGVWVSRVSRTLGALVLIQVLPSQSSFVGEGLKHPEAQGPAGRCERGAFLSAESQQDCEEIAAICRHLDLQVEAGSAEDVSSPAFCRALAQRVVVSEFVVVGGHEAHALKQMPRPSPAFNRGVGIACDRKRAAPRASRA